MLSTAKIGTGSWRYYSNQISRGRCEYFLGIGEAPGRWQGRGLDAFGLAPAARVSERELEALFGRALHPSTHQRLGRAWRADGVTGYDLCFSAPKSVSVLWALGEPGVTGAVIAAHHAAVRSALDYLDGHAAFSRVGTDGMTQVTTDGVAAAVFAHRTSRAGDPQLHSHALVVNKVRCPDGQWRTIDGHEIYAHKKSAGTVYQAALRNEVSRRLGVSWTPVSKDGQAEIAGVPTELIRAWSTRAREVTGEAAPLIAAYEAELGRELSSAERTAVQKVAVLKTRPGKEHVDIVALSQRWETEAAELGWDGLGVQRAVGAASRRPPGTDRLSGQMDRAVLDALVAAGGRRAVFTRSDLLAEVAARFPTGGFDAALVRDLLEQLTDQALNHPETVTLRPHTDGPERTSDARCASRTTLDAELRILTVADGGRGAGIAVIDPALVRGIARRHGLDGSQQAALVRVTATGDAISVLVAPAGTGKTTALAAAVTAWHTTRQRVILLAPSARAAAELRDATGTTADTVAKFLHDQAPPPLDPFNWPATDSRLSAGDVLVVDEASMLATRDLDALTTATWRAGAKLVLVGDPAQIGAVDAAGGMLPALADRLHAPSLEQVHRFTAPWERHASLQLRAGIPAVIDTYEAAGRIHDYPDDTTALTGVLAHYKTLADAGRRVLMLARTRRDVDTLNALARNHAIDTRVVHGPVLIDGPLEWRAGDRLRATRNTRSIDVGGDYLRNGDEFTVLTRHGDGLHVQSLDRNTTTVLPADYVTTHTRYGWAATIDAAQGATIDDALLLARPGIDREHLYVGLTRGRHSNHLYLTATAGDTDHHPRPEPATTAREILARALATSDLQAAAHTQLADPTGMLTPALPPPVRQTPARSTIPRPWPRALPRPSERGIEPDHYSSRQARGLEHDDRDFGGLGR